MDNHAFSKISRYTDFFGHFITIKFHNKEASTWAIFALNPKTIMCLQVQNLSLGVSY